MNLKDKVKEYIIENNLIAPGETIVIGVSGGPDSVTLTHILHKLQFDIDFRLHIAHFNHNLRRGAREDQLFVKKLSAKLNIPFSTKEWKNAKKQVKGSLEELARKQRIEFFNKISKEHSAKTIALAHNEDDLAETVLMKILRGCGLSGLRGILPKRKLGNLTFIRPLLSTPRKDIEQYLRKNKISSRIDPTNNQSIFTRNKIRLSLIPLLEKQYSPNIKQLLANLSQNADNDYNFLETNMIKVFSKIAKVSKAKTSVSFSKNEFHKQHPAIKKMLLRQSVELLKGNTNRLTSSHINDILKLLASKKKSSSLNLPNNLTVKTTSSTLSIKTT